MKGSSSRPKRGLAATKISFNTVTSIVNNTLMEGTGVSVKNIAQGQINKTFYQKKLSSEPYSTIPSSRLNSNRSSQKDDQMSTDNKKGTNKHSQGGLGQEDELRLSADAFELNSQDEDEEEDSQ